MIAPRITEGDLRIFLKNSKIIKIKKKREKLQVGGLILPLIFRFHYWKERGGIYTLKVRKFLILSLTFEIQVLTKKNKKMKKCEEKKTKRERKK